MATIYLLSGLGADENADKVLPIENIRQTDFVIPGGEHLMIYSKAEAINQVLKKILQL